MDREFSETHGAAERQYYNRVPIPNSGNELRRALMYAVMLLVIVTTARAQVLWPCRQVDTRSGYGGKLVANKARTFTLAGAPCGLAPASAYMVNIAVVKPSATGWLLAWQNGQPQPNASTVNFTTGQTTANFAIVQADTAGAIQVIATAAADVVIDMAGYINLPPPGTMCGIPPPPLPNGSILAMDGNALCAGPLGWQIVTTPVSAMVLCPQHAGN